LTHEQTDPADREDPEHGTIRRPKSTIRFPYVGLDEVASICETMLNTYSGRCSVVQLASALNQTARSGAFRVKVTAAKTFGVVTGRGETLVLTKLGSALVDPLTRRRAAVEAFLNVPLYRAIFEAASQRSGMMPDNIRAIEQEVVRLGVVEGQAETARLAFARSARYAGFYEHGKGRLIMPALGAESESAVAPPQLVEPDSAPHDEEVLQGKPAILVEIFKRLPDEGQEWTREDRYRWGTALSAMLDLIYPESSDLRQQVERTGAGES